MMKKVRFLLFILFIASCSNIYTQPGVNAKDFKSFVTIYTQTEKEHSVLTGFDHRVVITSHNGKFLFRPGWGHDYPDVLQVKSGRHVIKVRYDYFNTYSTGCLWLDAQEGETYIVKRLIKAYSVAFWLENIRTQKPVGGPCGSEPKEENNKAVTTKA